MGVHMTSPDSIHNNVEDHDKSLRKYCERVKNNHEYSEPSSQLISLLNDCFQLDCWSPQSRAQSTCLSHGESLPQQRSLFQNK